MIGFPRQTGSTVSISCSVSNKVYRLGHSIGLRYANGVDSTGNVNLPVFQ